MLLLIFLGVAGSIGMRRRPPRPEPPANVGASIGATRFSYAPALARDAATRGGGATDRLAFVVRFPNFTPVPAGKDDSREEEGNVLVTLTPHDEEAVDPAERCARLYARFLESDVWSGPGGLVARDFEAGGPYELERLYLTPPDGALFFARCPKREAGFLGAASCIWALRWRSLDVEVRFAPALLERWDGIVEGTRGFLRRVEAEGGEPRRRPQ